MGEDTPDAPDDTSGVFIIMNDIDLVIPWVDGNDPEWLEERNKYTKYQKVNPGYYQDWGWMRYWFRCVEKNLPWVRNIFFVTCGHTPDWLNLNHPKIKIVNHKEFMPQEFIPAFNSNSISLNIHRIEGLSENFIYAEDDIFFVGKHEPQDFFSENGFPKDFFWLKPITEQFRGDFAHIILNNTLLLKKHFEMRQITKQNKQPLFSLQYPEAAIADNKRYMDLNFIPGFKEPHLAYSFCKSTFEELWTEEPLELYKCCMHKFRTIADINVILARDWQLASGNFSPYYQTGRYFTDTSDPKLKELILSKDTKMICINESDKQGYTKHRADEICSCFEKRFPGRSSYELD